MELSKRLKSFKIIFNLEIMIKNTLIFFLITISSLFLFSQQYHVAKHGNDNNLGTVESPFLTISKAAKIALPGSVITVHEGTYRERIAPSHGGLSTTKPIIYQAAKGEDVWIKGSEIIKQWKKFKGNVWMVKIDNKFFGDFNPYVEIVQGDWLLNTYGMDHHLGEVYLNGDSLYEVGELSDVSDENPLGRTNDKDGSRYKWFCKTENGFTTIYANFMGLNPNDELVEINVRPAVFFPKKTGINFITVRGFKMAHAATQWSPPTAEQVGLIGPYWSKGWIIEDNLITDSKCTGISIGKERASGHNEWTNLKVKHGTQRERDVVFKALKLGWSFETIGSHIIRNNTIKNCEQTGISGHLGGIGSQIYNNHIYNIHIKKQFFGYETGGIKLHAPIDVIIKNNLIHDNYRGIWLDWQSQGTRVSGNIFYNNEKEDLFNEVNHGPMVVDNNIMLSEISILNASQGTAYAHNLITGKIIIRKVSNRYTPYHFSHSTSVKGLMTILTGDDRYYNNILTSNHQTKPYKGPASDKIHNGLDAYDGYPLSSDYWYKGKRPDDFAKHKLPVYINSNLYFNKAKPFDRELDNFENREFVPKISIEKKKNSFYLNFEIDDSFKKVKTSLVNTNILGTAFQSEAAFENKDASPIVLDTDILNNKRNVLNPIVGPFEKIKKGKNYFKIFTTQR
mgnify:FL=1